MLEGGPEQKRLKMNELDDFQTSWTDKNLVEVGDPLNTDSHSVCDWLL